MEKEDWHNGYEIHAYSFIKIWKIVRAIKKGEKTACNYSMLSYLYDNFDILNNKAIKRNALYYALKAIRTDKNYPPAYWLAGSTYFALNKYDLSEKYLTKAECLEALGDIKEAQKNYAIYNELSKDET
jgi:hypothetical protein